MQDCCSRAEMTLPFGKLLIISANQTKPVCPDFQNLAPRESPWTISQNRPATRSQPRLAGVGNGSGFKWKHEINGSLPSRVSIVRSGFCLSVLNLIRPHIERGRVPCQRADASFQKCNPREISTFLSFFNSKPLNISDL